MPSVPLPLGEHPAPPQRCRRAYLLAAPAVGGRASPRSTASAWREVSRSSTIGSSSPSSSSRSWGDMATEEKLRRMRSVLKSLGRRPARVGLRRQQQQG